jgi:regulatory protein
MVITGIERHKRRRRVNLFVDGRFALALALTLSLEKGLHTGMTVSDDDLQTLREEDERRTAYDGAIRLLSYRPRSEKEIRMRLARRGIGPAIVEETAARLRQLHYLDDAAFAQFWRESRENVSPRSRRLIRSELLFKGVDAETATATVEDVDDEEAAYTAAAKRLRALDATDYDAFHRRLGGFLTRRGFSYDVTRRTLERCWREIGGAPQP